MSIWNRIKHGVKGAEKAIGGGAKTVWHATTSEENDIASAIESAGTTMSAGLVDGAKYAVSWSEEGAAIAYKSAVDAGKYVNQHACDIAVGSALSAVFATLAADGEEESSLGALATACALSTLDRAVISALSKALAAIISDPIWLIPGASLDGKLTKDELRLILAFIINKCCITNPKLVVETEGQFIVGALIACTTNLICEGTLPGGYKP